MEQKCSFARGRGATFQQLLQSSLIDLCDLEISGSEVSGSREDSLDSKREGSGSSGEICSGMKISMQRARGRGLSNVFPCGGRGLSFGRGLSLSSLKLPGMDKPLGSKSNTSELSKLDKATSSCESYVASQFVSDKKDDPCKSFVKSDVQEDVVKYHGSSGSDIPMFVNCVKVKCRNDAVYQYHVSFDPVVDSKNLRFILLYKHQTIIGPTKAFDGTILYLPKQLDSEVHLKSVRFTDNAEIKISIRLTQKLHPSSYKLVPFYNVVLKRAMQMLKMCPVGRNYYDPTKPKLLERLRLMLWPGYVTAIKTFEGGLLLNIDIAHKVLRNETARHVMENLFIENKNLFRENCIKELVGAVVLTKYNNKNYRVDDIAWDLTPTSTFCTSKGETISYVDYYKTQYKITIKDELQPMLIHRPKKATQRNQRDKEGADKVICLVPELCFLTGLSDKLRADFRAMKEIKDHACLPPDKRISCIEEFLHRINTSPEAKVELLKWGLEVDSSSCQVTARQFPPEKVMVGGQQVFTCGPQADFSREVTRSNVIRPVMINNWLLVFTRRDVVKAENFFKKLLEVCRKLGVELNKPHFIELRDDRSTTYKDAISSAVNPSVQLVVCIFPTSRDDRYSAVKKLCCVDMPVPSQVIISRTLPDDPKIGKFRSVTMKIALQINCKLGGELWAVDIPLKGIMICGIDVYHDSSGRGNSVAAFVASTNQLMTRWYSRAVVQQPRQEVMSSLKHCFTEALKKYYEVNHSLPIRVVIFRDGVGDGQLKEVAEHEVEQIASCFAMFDKVYGEQYLPKLTVVVVSKRINVKFFSGDKKALGNPPPGSVLDHLATRPNWPDFFLVSQHVRHGTVSPTHYIVVGGSQHLKPDHMQRLAYKMTHMYYNWPGTVRVPAPCQYAHKLAYLVGQNIRQEPSLRLCDRLFYL